VPRVRQSGQAGHVDIVKTLQPGAALGNYFLQLPSLSMVEAATPHGGLHADDPHLWQVEETNLKILAKVNIELLQGLRLQHQAPVQGLEGLQVKNPDPIID